MNQMHIEGTLRVGAARPAKKQQEPSTIVKQRNKIKVADMAKTTVRMDPATEEIIDRVYGDYFETVDVVKCGAVVGAKERRLSKQKFMAWLFEVALGALGHMDQERVRAKYHLGPRRRT